MRRQGTLLVRPPTRRRVTAVVDRLRATYGDPRLGNPTDPVADLVFVLLSARTPPSRGRATYDALRTRYSCWEDLLAAPEPDLAALLAPAGLARRRSHQIRGAIAAIRAAFGSVTLDPLRNRSEGDAEELLVSLPGVSRKTAKCVMMYTLGFKVLPVDVHVHRISSRLGWITIPRPEQSHAALEAIVPPALRYSLHVGCVAHGRAACTARAPQCPSCVLLSCCARASVTPAVLQTQAT